MAIDGAPISPTLIRMERSSGWGVNEYPRSQSSPYSRSARASPMVAARANNTKRSRVTSPAAHAGCLTFIIPRLF